jgi:GxxExxY protein
LERRLLKRGLQVERQVFLPAVFEGERLEKAGRVDMIIESRVYVELKATRGLESADFAQLRTYLRMSGREVALPGRFTNRSTP